MSAPCDDGGRTERLSHRAEALLAEMKSLSSRERARLAQMGLSETDVAVLCDAIRLMRAADPKD